MAMPGIFEWFSRPCRVSLSKIQGRTFSCLITYDGRTQHLHKPYLGIYIFEFPFPEWLVWFVVGQLSGKCLNWSPPFSVTTFITIIHSPVSLFTTNIITIIIFIIVIVIITIIIVTIIRRVALLRRLVSEGRISRAGCWAENLNSCECKTREIWNHLLVLMLFKNKTLMALLNIWINVAVQLAMSCWVSLSRVGKL